MTPSLPKAGGPRLTGVRARGDWSPLLSQLGRWHQAGNDSWTDGVSRLSSSLPTDFTFSGVATPHFAVSPSRFKIGFEPGVSAPVDHEFVLNHVAVNVCDVDLERDWMERLLGADAVVLARARAFNPLTQDWQPDAHLFHRPNYYVTIRGTGGATSVDHCGWMTKTRAGVDRAATILHRLKWSILLGPTTIDASYLIHFEGPDGRVHDFFHPGAELDRLSE